jgi:phage baseplate assembly protein gpV
MFDTLNNGLTFIEGYGGKWIKGTVTQNVDPLNLDRVQVSIPGLYDPDLGDIPWIGPLKISPFGIGSNYGTYGTPTVGSDVAICLQNGDAHYPVYMHLQCFPNEMFPSGTSWGFQDPSGNQLLVQGKDIQFTSGGGFQIHIDESGNITVDVPSGGSGTVNIPNLTFNTTNTIINGDHVRINGIVTVTGNTTLDGQTFLLQLATFLGPMLSNGHDISDTHMHSGVTSGGDISGPVT